MIIKTSRSFYFISLSKVCKTAGVYKNGDYWAFDVWTLGDSAELEILFDSSEEANSAYASLLKNLEKLEKE